MRPNLLRALIGLCLPDGDEDRVDRGVMARAVMLLVVIKVMEMVET